MMNRRTFRITAGTLVVCAGMVTSAMAQLDDKPPTEPRQTYRPGQEGGQPKTTDKDRVNKRWEHGQTVVLAPSEWIEDNSVRGPNDEKLGEIKDLILARTPGRVTFAMLGHGGVLTIGETVNAVPFQAFDWNSGQKCLTLSLTPEQLKAAPTLNSGEWQTLGDPARTEPIFSFYNVNRDMNRNMDRDANRNADDDRRDRNPSTGKGDNSHPATGQPDRHQGDKHRSTLNPDEHRVLRLSDIRGKQLMSDDGREVGKVDDIVLDTSSGRIAFVAVTFGGVLGIGEDKVAVPWPEFDVNRDGHLYVTKIDKETIKGAPRLTQKDWGELREPGFASRVYQHFGVQGAWLDGGASSSGRDMSQAQSNYDRMYSAGTARNIQGRVTSVEEEAPVHGMDQLVVLTVSTPSSDSVKVHVCPKAYLDENGVQLRKGDNVDITGRQTTIDGKPVVIATKVTSNGKPLEVRNEDGACKWTSH